MDNHWRVFQAIGQTGSLTEAAKKLYLTQPTVSQHLKALEDYYGATLVHRHSRGVTLTPEGEILLESAGQILDVLDRTKAQLQSRKELKKGKLNLGASLTIAEYLFPPLLGQFKALYPGIEVTMTMANTHNLLDHFVEGNLELAFVEGRMEQHPSLVCRDFLTDELVVVFPQHYEVDANGRVKIADILEEYLILREVGSGTRQITERYLAEQGHPLQGWRVHLELGSTEAIKGSVAAGLGITIISRLAVIQDVALGRLKALSLDPPLERKFHLVHRRPPSVLSAAARQFLDFLEGQIRSATIYNA